METPLHHCLSLCCECLVDHLRLGIRQPLQTPLCSKEAHLEHSQVPVVALGVLRTAGLANATRLEETGRAHGRSELYREASMLIAELIALSREVDLASEKGKLIWRSFGFDTAASTTASPKHHLQRPHREANSRGANPAKVASQAGQSGIASKTQEQQASAYRTLRIHTRSSLDPAPLLHLITRRVTQCICVKLWQQQWLWMTVSRTFSSFSDDRKKKEREKTLNS